MPNTVLYVFQYSTETKFSGFTVLMELGFSEYSPLEQSFPVFSGFPICYCNQVFRFFLYSTETRFSIQVLLYSTGTRFSGFLLFYWNQAFGFSNKLLEPVFQVLQYSTGTRHSGFQVSHWKQVFRFSSILLKPVTETRSKCFPVLYWNYVSLALAKEN